ncbi:MAG: hypothetical protein R3F41_14710 [Gammaproteobacteria bacterium]|nr:hypothetical protein [Pseudomonadales bacterium]MCP5347229.1 hypothetical protein [Pseudomonadales bacterium]
MGWILSWIAIGLIPLAQATTCTMGSEDSWTANLFVVTPANVLILGAIFLFRKHHTRWIWLSTPNFILLPWATIFLIQFFIGSTIEGNHLCSVLMGQSGFNEYAASWWQPFWAPVQLVLILSYSLSIYGCWRKRSNANQTS